MKTFLHVGCGSATKQHTTKGFNTDDWTEIRVDVESRVAPDIIGSMTDLGAVRTGSIDGIYSSHSLEHLYAHQVPMALAEFKRVLKPDGFVVLTCPDIQGLGKVLADDKAEDALYDSPAGKMTALDVLYGNRNDLARGLDSMAHKTGFTARTLSTKFKEAGFDSVMAARRLAPFYDLWCVATVSDTTDLRALAKDHFPEEPERSVVPKSKPPKVAVCIASSGQCKTQFAMSLGGLLAYYSSKRLIAEQPEQYIAPFLVESSTLAHNQHQLVLAAKNWGATHILWVEDDMQFPPDALHQLYKWRQPWVGANYPMRSGPPFEYTALGLNRQRVYTGAESTGLEEVMYTGYGVTLMDITIFDKLKMPYFQTEWLGNNAYATTDWYLSEKVREAGFKIYVDHDLSKQIGHVGGHVYHCAEVAAWKEAKNG